MFRRSVHVVIALSLLFALGELKAQDVPAPGSAILRDVKTVQVDPTVVSDANKVKEEFAANRVQSSLRSAFRSAGIEVADSAPLRAHIVLDEFSSGSTAKRFMVSFGAGRSTIACHLLLQDADGKELSNTKIRVRGGLALSSVQGNNSQRREAVASLEQKLLETIEKLK